jgi:hypothetical protein
MTTHTELSAASHDLPDHQELPRLRDSVGLLTQLRSSLAYHEVVDGKDLPPLLAYLSAWQSVRLARTYADLLHDAEFSLACRFFLTDIYGPQDFSQRDYDGTRIYNFMNRFLPEATLRPLQMALQVNEVTQQLDQALVRAMLGNLGVTDRFEQWHYEEGYRLCDNYDLRVRQIDLILAVGHRLELVRHLPFVGTTLRLARGPAHRLGWYDMQAFLERGFVAWKSLRRPEVFLNTIERREKAILNRIYRQPDGAPESNPFLVTDGGSPQIVLPLTEAMGS